MSLLSIDLINKFVKATKDDTRKSKSESTVYGTTVEQNGRMYVKLDGSEGRLTPVSTTTDAKAGERVLVMIKNHTATITGNITSPSARAVDVADAGKNASNFMYHSPEHGLEIGDKTSGEWVGCRTQTKSDSFNILDEDGETVASYGKNKIELGLGEKAASVGMCNNQLEFEYDSELERAVIDSENDLLIESSGAVMMYSLKSTDDNYSALMCSDEGVAINASDGFLLDVKARSDIWVKPDYIEVSSKTIQLNGEVYVNSKSLLDVLHPVNSVYISYSHDNPADLFGGTWERINTFFLSAAGEDDVIGDEVVVATIDTGAKDYGIKVSMWRRTA